MSFWPRLKLTPEEAKYSSKYWDPSTGRRGVLRRMYQGFLELNQVKRRDSFSFQIARRSRVFALTASGDIPQFRMQIQDASGENYLATSVCASNLFGGYNQVPTSINEFAEDQKPYSGQNATVSPFVIEPNIVLMPNQTLNVIAEPYRQYDGVDYRIDLVVHCWEFPGFPGSPL